jgi:hypothetical protein
MKSLHDLGAKSFIISSQEEASHVEKWMLDKGIINKDGDKWDAIYNKRLFFCYPLTKYFWTRGDSTATTTFDDLYEYGMPSLYIPEQIIDPSPSLNKLIPTDLDNIRKYCFIISSNDQKKSINSILEKLGENTNLLSYGYTENWKYVEFNEDGKTWTLNKRSKNNLLYANLSDLEHAVMNIEVCNNTDPISAIGEQIKKEEREDIYDEPLDDNIILNGPQKKKNSYINSLVREAKNKGFVSNSSFVDLVNTRTSIISTDVSYIYYSNNDTLYINVVENDYGVITQRIYQNGYWATIVKKNNTDEVKLPEGIWKYVANMDKNLNIDFIQPNDSSIKISLNVPLISVVKDLKQPQESIYF